MSKIHRGSLLDDLLEDEGILDEVRETALRQVIAWQLEEERLAQGISKAELARRMGTSRSQVDRLLKAEEPGIQLETLERGARAVGRHLKVELV
ncbi:MAG: helix-turn-helix domain-containing protein [Thermomicrobiales bacterium]